MSSSIDAKLTWQRGGTTLQQNIKAQIDSEGSGTYTIFIVGHSKEVLGGDEFLDVVRNKKYQAVEDTDPFQGSHIEIPVKRIV